MKPRYSLRKTLYRDAPRIDQFRMSGATAQKIRVAGLESVFVGGGNDGTGGGVRVGQEVVPILAPQAKAPQPVNINVEPSTSTPLQDPCAKLRELCRKERERGVSLVLEKMVENPILMSRSLVADLERGESQIDNELGQAPCQYNCETQSPSGKYNTGARGARQFNNCSRAVPRMCSGVTYAGAFSLYEGWGGPGLLGVYCGDPPSFHP